MLIKLLHFTRWSDVIANFITERQETASIDGTMNVLLRNRITSSYGRVRISVHPTQTIFTLQISTGNPLDSLNNSPLCHMIASTLTCSFAKFSPLSSVKMTCHNAVKEEGECPNRTLRHSLKEKGQRKFLCLVKRDICKYTCLEAGCTSRQGRSQHGTRRLWSLAVEWARQPSAVRPPSAWARRRDERTIRCKCALPFYGRPPMVSQPEDCWCLQM